MKKHFKYAFQIINVVFRSSSVFIFEFWKISFFHRLFIDLFIICSKDTIIIVSDTRILCLHTFSKINSEISSCLWKYRRSSINDQIITSFIWNKTKILDLISDVLLSYSNFADVFSTIWSECHSNTTTHVLMFVTNIQILKRIMFASLHFHLFPKKIKLDLSEFMIMTDEQRK